MSTIVGPVEIAHNDFPPSLNTLLQSSGFRWRYRSTKKQWQDTLLRLLTEADMPRCERVVVEGEVTFPTRTRRDQGNTRWLLEKALGDALVEGAFLPDDSWQHFEFGGLAAKYEKGVRRTRLILFPSGG